MPQQKQVFIIGGPNGAGKTTAAFLLMPELVNCSEYVNADAIASSLSPFNPDAIAVRSGKLMLTRIKELIAHNQNFAFETTMASRHFVNLLKTCKAQGYQINLLYVWLASPILAKARVEHRVLTGGHSIPPDVIERRYMRGIENFQKIYIPLADRWIVCDNSSLAPSLVAQKHKRFPAVEVYDEKKWAYFATDINLLQHQTHGNETNTKLPPPKIDFLKRMEIGVQRGVSKALDRHKKLGESIVIWRDGKVVVISPEAIEIPPFPDDKALEGY